MAKKNKSKGNNSNINQNRNNRDLRTDPEKQTINPIFGQAPAFAINDSLVDPQVVAYLRDVRQEALRTTVTRIPEQKKVKPIVTASMYDDDEKIADNTPLRSRYESDVTQMSATMSVFPDKLIQFRQNMEQCIEWFKTARNSLIQNGYRYDDTTLNLLVYYFKKYLEERNDQDDYVKHLAEVLQHHFVENEDDSLIIDNEWAERTLAKIREGEVRTIDDIKKFISGNSYEPYGFSQWYEYLLTTEPTHSCFCSVINGRNIWILVQYYQQGLLEKIYSNDQNSDRLNVWLLYILFHLPNNITANSTSLLRDLGKKCQNIILRNVSNAGGPEPSDVNSGLLVFTNELNNLSIPQPPEYPFTIVDLTLIVISELYGQKDLINWETVYCASKQDK
ncbi:Brr1p NDAI_0A05250 [Naumovozyma dairenensis CBS 421]|uniref:Uncharacterized protein n=1 Tax=Naumovozyma dairenensis (strain ATCC 10597 / BCRC 20456 / CBS 421 / NBRC 0211 / NRRL Y-12639) TaxID=1071378 RepID=G0W4E2_NAUDC|nr:hypothetical protein NDAI_0A05250 [Naumovozyma dairenensis CBS 421]CCD22680.1 hypothetical protein NDAI_0A05250 [Naumovozyma dairenensis CBS 421]